MSCSLEVIPCFPFLSVPPYIQICLKSEERSYFLPFRIESAKMIRESKLPCKKCIIQFFAGAFPACVRYIIACQMGWDLLKYLQLSGAGWQSKSHFAHWRSESTARTTLPQYVLSYGRWNSSTSGAFSAPFYPQWWYCFCKIFLLKNHFLSVGTIQSSLCFSSRKKHTWLLEEASLLRGSHCLSRYWVIAPPVEPFRLPFTPSDYIALAKYFYWRTISSQKVGFSHLCVSQAEKTLVSCKANSEKRRYFHASSMRTDKPDVRWKAHGEIYGTANIYL